MGNRCGHTPHRSIDGVAGHLTETEQAQALEDAHPVETRTSRHRWRVTPGRYADQRQAVKLRIEGGIGLRGRRLRMKTAGEEGLILQRLRSDTMPGYCS